MSHHVVFSAAARRDLKGIPPRIVPAIIEFAYGDLTANPLRVGKPLQRELAGSYSARRGPYRIIFDIDQDAQTVQILRIDHRADAYRSR